MGRDDVEIGHDCARCGRLASVYVVELELGCPRGEPIALCNEHGARGTLESVRGMAHG